MNSSSEDNSPAIDYQTLAEMPAAELAGLGEQIGLKVPADAARQELLDLIRRRVQLIDQLDRQALLDIVIWAHRPVRRSAGKLDLVREIGQIRLANCQKLSHRGLYALAKLRGLQVDTDTPADRIVRLLYRQQGLGGFLARKRRSLIGSLLGKLIDSPNSQDDYQFLPEPSQQPTLQEQIEHQGIVGGLASKIRGAADNYINAKLDEIDHRIDTKLNQIDQRLAQWRDQEVANRLRIIKITLIASVLVMLISLCYNYVKSGYITPPADQPPAKLAR